MFATTRLFSEVTPRAVWFFSGGIALVLTGEINVLNHSYGAVAAGLKRVCVGTNVVMTLFAAVAGTVTKASVGELVIIVALMGAATVLSLLKRLPKS